MGQIRAKNIMFCLGIASYLKLLFVVEGTPHQDPVNQ